VDNLAQLRDIHLPHEVSMFPLGYGAVGFFVLLVVALFLYPYLRRLYLKSKKHYALSLIKSLKKESMEDVCMISQILRRACKIKHKEAVALFSKSWIDFLKKTTSYKLTEQQFNMLLNAPYAPTDRTIEKKDFEALKNFAVKWVEENL